MYAAAYLAAVQWNTMVARAVAADGSSGGALHGPHGG